MKPSPTLPRFGWLLLAIGAAALLWQLNLLTWTETPYPPCLLQP